MKVLKEIEAIDTSKIAQYDGYLAVVNQKPHTSWVTSHSFAKDVDYIPIGVIEALLTQLFQQWRVEVIETKQLLNSIAVTVRLHYLNPISGWTFHDGVGAVPIQTDKGKSPADLASIKNDAIMKSLPAAKSYAIKDAADHIGVLFGRDLNRKDVIDFKPLYDEADDKKKEVRKKNENN